MNSGLVSAVVAIMGFLVTGAVVFGSWRVSRNTTATQQYRDTALAWEGKARAQDAEISDLKQALAAKDSQIADLSARVAVLQDTVTGKSALEILEARSAEMLQMSAEVRTVVRANTEILADLRDKMAGTVP